jgi:hypothetical protein
MPGVLPGNQPFKCKKGGQEYLLEAVLTNATVRSER